MTSATASSQVSGQVCTHRVLIRWRDTTYTAPCALAWVVATVWCLGLVLAMIALALRKPTPRHAVAATASVDAFAQRCLALLRASRGLRVVTPRFVLLVR